MSRLVVAIVAALWLGCQSGVPQAPSKVIDLNTATVKELEALPAIGPDRARSIIASRNARGGKFQRLEDILQIDGIGPKTVDAIRPYVVVVPKP
jgi:competence protein ComEA